MRRPQTEWNARQFKLHCTTRERLNLLDLRQLTGVQSEADVLRLAMQRLCDHYDLDRDGRLWKLREAKTHPRKKASASQQRRKEREGKLSQIVRTEAWYQHAKGGEVES